jgi:hypothetical protein
MKRIFTEYDQLPEDAHLVFSDEAISFYRDEAGNVYVTESPRVEETQGLNPIEADLRNEKISYKVPDWSIFDDYYRSVTQQLGDKAPRTLQEKYLARKHEGEKPDILAVAVAEAEEHLVEAYGRLGRIKQILQQRGVTTWVTHKP